ncbi:MAG: L,D-transpeptidase family protein, partial [Pseudomonadota bacterium]
KYAIVVEKFSQQLFLYHIKGDAVELVKTFQCSTGKSRGDKEERGDLKTPEGCYFFKEIKNDRQLPAKYGAMAFILDFPNFLDEKEKKGGNGIWLHGLDKPFLPYDTQGCVALKNEDLLALSSYIKLFETPIIIEEKVSYATAEEMKKDKDEAKKLLAQWQHAWEEKELEKFMQCYSPDKFGQGNLNKLKSTKQLLNDKYKFIDVDVRNMNIVRHDKMLIAGFVQDYESDSFHSAGYKKLYLQKNSDNLKIIGEDWVDSGHGMTFGATTVTDERNLRRLLNAWVKSWENKRLEDYMDCYSKKFTSQKMNWMQWKDYKAEINRTTKAISISVEKPKMHLDGTKATLSYVQKYVSDAHTDQGLKKLQLQKENNGWKITAESWEPI